MESEPKLFEQLPSGDYLTWQQVAGVIAVPFERVPMAEVVPLFPPKRYLKEVVLKDPNDPKAGWQGIYES